MTFIPTDYKPYDFANRRHIGPSPQEMDEMLRLVGAKDLDALIDDTVPAGIRLTEALDFGKPKSERELLYHMRRTASKNTVLTSLIGQGFHGTVTPPVIQRNILENPAWYTAYTPYQPEISQGRLEALLNFQTMVSDLTGLEIANASLLDEATACADVFSIDSLTGQITWDTPCEPGIYVIRILIRELRDGNCVGIVNRDMQIEVLDNPNHAPDVLPINDTCIIAGTDLDITVIATDEDLD